MNEQAMATYRSLLQEIKYRTEAIDSVLAKKIPLRAKVGEELCYLQLRMICELIAIGCLVIHGNMKPKADLYKTYKADWIIGELGKLHPKFFPNPLENNDEYDEGRAKWVHRTSGFLTKDELAVLWSRHAGAALHRGNAKNILVKDPPLRFEEIQRWRDKIVGLLTRHIVISPDEEMICYFVMNARGTGEVASNLFEKIETPPLSGWPAGRT